MALLDTPDRNFHLGYSGEGNTISPVDMQTIPACGAVHHLAKVLPRKSLGATNAVVAVNSEVVEQTQPHLAGQSCSGVME